MGEAAFRIVTIARGALVEVKKSRFIAELMPIGSEAEAIEFVSSVRKKYYDARHHCFALRTGRPGSVFERSSDDGEPSGTAGRPMLDILRGADLLDVCAVVTRYFGGTLLGTGGLVRAYSDALKSALAVSETALVSEGVLMRIGCPYQVSDALKQRARERKCSLMHQEYTDECVFDFLVPQGSADSFLSELFSVSLGRADLRKLREVYYYTSGEVHIYGREDVSG